MKTLDYQKLERASQQKFNFNIGDYINRAYQIFSKEWVNFVFYSFVMIGILIFSMITIIGPYLLMYPLIMGYFVVAEKIENNEQVSFNDFFGGMKNYGQYFVFMLIQALCSLLLIIPFIVWAISLGVFSNTLSGDISEGAGALFASSILILIPFFILGSIAIQVFTFLTPFLIHYGNLSAIEAFKLSIQIGKKNFWYILLFIVVNSFISSLGVIACYVGLLVTIPIAYLMIYSMVNDLLLDTKTELDTIGTDELSY